MCKLCHSYVDISSVHNKLQWGLVQSDVIIARISLSTESNESTEAMICLINRKCSGADRLHNILIFFVFSITMADHYPNVF